MKNKKKRNTGRYYPHIAEKYKLDYLRENCLLPQEEWDEWKDHRDGLRNKKNLNKIKKEIKLRKLKQEKRTIIHQLRHITKLPYQNKNG